MWLRPFRSSGLLRWLVKTPPLIRSASAVTTYYLRDLVGFGKMNLMFHPASNSHIATPTTGHTPDFQHRAKP